jgi:hypothetical protein
MSSFTCYRVFLIVLAGTVGALSVFLMTYGMQREKSARASAMRMSSVLASFIFQATITSDEPVSWLSIIGAVLIVLGILLIVFMKSRADRDAHQAAGSSTATPRMGQKGMPITPRTTYNSLDSGHTPFSQEAAEAWSFNPLPFD